MLTKTAENSFKRFIERQQSVNADALISHEIYISCERQKTKNVNLLYKRYFYIKQIGYICI